MARHLKVQRTKETERNGGTNKCREYIPGRRRSRLSVPSFSFAVLYDSSRSPGEANEQLTTNHEKRIAVKHIGKILSSAAVRGLLQYHATENNQRHPAFRKWKNESPTLARAKSPSPRHGFRKRR